MRYLLAFIICALLILGVASCAAKNKTSVKKCDGKKGVKTGMGVM
ncbi:MAG: hypothetical protein ACI9J3_002644 [Parvicellaceae bacterium]|jgi:hypothetical protein